MVVETGDPDVSRGVLSLRRLTSKRAPTASTGCRLGMASVSGRSETARVWVAIADHSSGR